MRYDLLLLLDIDFLFDIRVFVVPLVLLCVFVGLETDFEQVETGSYYKISLVIDLVECFYVDLD